MSTPKWAEGDRVRSLRWQWEYAGRASSGESKPPLRVWVHAKPGDEGIVVHVDEDYPEASATVRFEPSGTATAVADRDIERVG